jgi:hypothetical protein
VTFTATDASVLCSAVTDGSGRAACPDGSGRSSTLSVLLGGYDVTFPGDRLFAASRAHGTIALLPALLPGTVTSPTPSASPAPTPSALGPGTGKALPVTGLDTGWWLAAAAACIVLGIAALRRSSVRGG